MRRGVMNHGEPEETDEGLGGSQALPKAATGLGAERRAEPTRGGQSPRESGGTPGARRSPSRCDTARPGNGYVLRFL